MGVRRFELTRSSAAVKRAFDLLGASLGLLAISPLIIVIAIAIKLDGRGPVFFRQPRVGRHGKHFNMLKFRTMVPGADATEELLARPQRSQGGAVQDRRRPPGDARWRVPAQKRSGRASPAPEHRQREDEPRWTAPARGRRGPVCRGVAPSAPGAEAGDDGALADPRTCACPAAGDGGDRLLVRSELVALGRHQDHAAHGSARHRTARTLRCLDELAVATGGHSAS